MPAVFNRFQGLSQVLWPLVFIACHTPGHLDRVGTTWEDDQSANLTRPARRPLKASAVKTIAPTTIGAKTKVQDSEKLAHELELALIQFSSARKEVPVAPDQESGKWPPAMMTLWKRALDQLEVGFGLPPGELPKRLLIQTRVALEVELELTQRRFGPAPEALLGRISTLYGRVAQHMRARPDQRLSQRRASHHKVKIHWPMSPIIVTSPFGYRRDPILGASQMRFHAGLDLGGRAGDVVSAAAPGRVVSAGWSGGHGRMVVVQHAGGYSTVYAHLRRILVHQGATIKVGEPLGLVGSSGRSTGPHLHFEVKRGGIPINPAEVLDRYAPLVSSSTGARQK